MPTGLEFFDRLLHEYRKVWNNRLLNVENQNSEEILKDAIKRELLDENSHPRVRKNRYEKYYSAIKRLVDSNISTETKVHLIEVHNQMMDELK
ncbi:hypothetical protein ABE288_16320 [Bacillus salipaludis]|uniref:Uncharacterized protein n=1 Tax=Bacillus salipaludis TaxID=2547811 RepID=A0A4R5VRK3_9BACI|nr:hypothetical protein [Bacillus salipaludis]MDQ6599316.1 hypothetical protein [Bacillus salipaludis]TDK60401.1 hypothetical protein E2K98_17005 [Bacillus salipaludis]